MGHFKFKYRGFKKVHILANVISNQQLINNKNQILGIEGIVLSSSQKNNSMENVKKKERNLYGKIQEN